MRENGGKPKERDIGDASRAAGMASEERHSEGARPEPRAAAGSGAEPGLVYSPLGDSAVLIRFGERIDPKTIEAVRNAADRLEAAPFPGFVEAVPSYAALAVYYEPWTVYRERRAGPEPEDRSVSLYETVCDRVRAVLSAASGADAEEAGAVTVPVCYGGAYGPDLDAVAAYHGLRAEDVVALHAGADYVVAMIGFAPGFPYLAGLPDELATPRRATPRASVPAGSVGIAGGQTGIYPLETPGGWNVIGRTPLALFKPHDAQPSLLRAGDRVRFEPVTPERFEQLAAAAAAEAGAGRRRAGGAAWTEAAKPAGGGAEREGALAIVERPGVLATVQDGGRAGSQRLGVSAGGAADGFALRAANALAGNAPDAAALELTLGGFALRFAADALVAVAGGGSAPTVDGEPLPRWRAVFVRRGAQLAFAPAASGCRAYLAVAGGFAVPAVLGSRGTHVPAGIGGLDGRPLRAGDVLPLGAAPPAATGLLAALRRRADAAGAAWAAAPWGVSPYALPAYADRPVVRVTPGPEYGRFAPDVRRLLVAAPFVVSPRSDRMGCRLDGPRLALDGAGGLLSEPVTAGTIQVPPDGGPVVLLADRQTTGGYPRIAQVAEADVPLLAQARPGTEVRFEMIGAAESERLLLERRQAERRLAAGIGLRMRLAADETETET
ncbi:5-oxoprolinase subunit PxpB [Paenibacillus flagellatus]|nr:5-oxoprolinase subunit PxpB [Paenibacillus flagellatus]